MDALVAAVQPYLGVAVFVVLMLLMHGLHGHGGHQTRSGRGDDSRSGRGDDSRPAARGPHEHD